MSATPAPRVTREALCAFTQRLVQHPAPEQVILFGSQARGNARLDSDADLLVVMPFEGTTGAAVQAMLNTLTQAALACLDPAADHPEPAEDMAWALAQASPLRNVLQCWFDNLPAAPDGTDAQGKT